MRKIKQQRIYTIYAQACTYSLCQLDYWYFHAI